jgi:hypothetical protein
VSGVSRGIDRIEVVFDDPNLVANAGLLVPATLMARLGLEALVNATVRLRGRVGGASLGRKVCTLVAAMVAGGSHIDHANVLHAGATQAVLGFRVMAPSTLGTFLRAFTFGHVRQLDRVIAETIGRAWALGAGPAGEGPLVIDMDSTVCEVHGHAKQGAAYGYTRKLGYHPLLATRAETGEVLHARLRKGSSQRGHKRFVEELIARVRRAGATGALCLRADGGFWSHELIDTLRRLNVGWSITVRINKTIRAAIGGIDETAWLPIVYPDGGQAAVAETTYTTGKGPKRRSYRLVVRRSRLTEVAQQALWPDWRYHAFVTSSIADAVTADRFHRDHAGVELAIRDLKHGAGLAHCPSGRFFANAAWLACAVLTHNLFRWCATLGGIRHLDELTVAPTLRSRLIAVPARLVNHAGTPTWRGPLNWPWADLLTRALTNLRALPPAPT